MKTVRLDLYRPPLHRIASRMWGGDCSVERTTMPGVSYYSCAGHGGYVADGMRFPEDVRKVLEQALPKERLLLAVQHSPGQDWVLGEDFQLIGDSFSRRRGKSIHYNPSLGSVEWIEYPVFSAEEDEMWCDFEAITGVHMVYDDPFYNEEWKRKHDQRVLECATKLRERGE